MTDKENLAAAAARFDAALSRLEAGLSAAVSKVADLARATGYEDGLAAARAEAPVDDGGGPVLREALATAKAREATLQAAVDEARAALDDAIDDIRAALGPV
jgi:flagellar biosynthesis/type III secretory pathway protein FliH